MTLHELVDDASEILKDRISGVKGHLGTLDALLSCYGDYGVTVGCIALFTPTIRIERNIPMAQFSGSNESLPLDCFHVDLLHHLAAESKNPIVLKCIGTALAIFWSKILQENQIPGDFVYDESEGFDVVYRK
jgi:hypothetical protein